MSNRWRKFLGGIAIVAFLVLYAMAAVVIGERLPDAWWIKMIYFAVVGVAWGVPLIPLLSWMDAARGPKKAR